MSARTLRNFLRFSGVIGPTGRIAGPASIPIMVKRLLDDNGEGAQTEGDPQGRQAVLSFESPLVIADDEGLVNFHRYARIDISRCADRTGGPIAERGVDQGISSIRNMEISSPG